MSAHWDAYRIFISHEIFADAKSLILKALTLMGLGTGSSDSLLPFTLKC